MIFTLKYWKFRSAIILLFLIAFSSSAQQLAISGVVYNEKGKKLPWVNIGIRNKNVGVTSAQDGTYQLIIPAGFEKEQLVFSCVGFEEYLIAVKDLTSQQQKIILYPKTILLNEVVITNQKRRILTLGTKGYTPLMWMNVGSKTGNYAEHGKLIEIKAPSKLLNASIRVGGDKKSKDSVIYRLNVYKVAKGLPSQRMIEKNIIKIFQVQQNC